MAAETEALLNSARDHRTVASDRATLDRKFSRSVRDNVVAECLIQVVRVVAMVLLARALGAAEFGLFRVLMVVAAFSIAGLEAGLAESLVQRKDLNAVHESTIWFISVIIGLSGAAILYAGAWVIAGLMAMPRLVGGIHLICLAIFLDCLAVTSNAHLQRELRFGTLASAEVTAEFAFLITALGLVWTTMSAWSLMAGLTARLATRALFLLIAAPRPPKTWPSLAAARELRSFAAGVWGGSVLSTISANADYLLVGRLLGVSALGFYTLAWDLLRFVPDRLHKVAGRVAFPAFSQIQENDRELARSYRNFIEYIGKVALPAAACAAVAAPELIGTVYGGQWLPAAQPMRALSLGLALSGLGTGIGSVCYAKGRPSVDIYLHSARLLLIIALVSTLASTGLVGISAAMSGVESLINIAGLLVAVALVKLSPWDLISASVPGLQLALTCAFAVLVGKALVFLCGISGPLVLLFIAIPPGAVFVGLERRTLASILAGAVSTG